MKRKYRKFWSCNNKPSVDWILCNLGNQQIGVDVWYLLKKQILKHLKKVFRVFHDWYCHNIHMYLLIGSYLFQVLWTKWVHKNCCKSVMQIFNAARNLWLNGLVFLSIFSRILFLGVFKLAIILTQYLGSLQICFLNLLFFMIGRHHSWYHILL